MWPMSIATDSLKTSQRLFSPASPFWQVNRELFVALAGPRVLLMELAHPLIAAGVAERSNFQRGGLGRLYRTAHAMAEITFGTAQAARKAASDITLCHKRVHGKLSSPVGPFPVGTAYDANDRDLRLWVLATLIDSSLLVYDRLIKRLSLAEKEAYYRDSRALAQILGIPRDGTPANYRDFVAYVKSMLASDLLTVSDTARELATALFASGVLGRVGRRVSFVSIGLLPERLREAYNFSWSQKKEERLRRLAAFSRRIRPLLPSVICVSPKALLAEWCHGNPRAG